jgi:hypothetical protein
MTNWLTAHENIVNTIYLLRPPSQNGNCPLRTGRYSMCGEKVLLHEEYLPHCRLLDPRKKYKEDLAGLHWEGRFSLTRKI